MMTFEEAARPSAREMLAHEWVREGGVAGDNVIQPEVRVRVCACVQWRVGVGGKECNGRVGTVFAGAVSSAIDASAPADALIINCAPRSCLPPGAAPHAQLRRDERVQAPRGNGGRGAARPRAHAACAAACAGLGF